MVLEMLNDIILDVYDREGNLLRRVRIESTKILKVTVEGQGESGTVEVEDMLTLWFFRYLAVLLTPVGVGGRATFSFTDVTGTARTQNAKRDSGGTDLFSDTRYCSNRLWIVVGSGITSPTRADFKLESKVGENVTTIHVDETTLTITLHGSIYFPSAVTVNEIGLEWEGTVASYNVCGRFLVDRTVLTTGVSVPDGGTLAVTYKFKVP